jgi:hypothetical protein
LIFLSEGSSRASFCSGKAGWQASPALEETQRRARPEGERIANRKGLRQRQAQGEAAERPAGALTGERAPGGYATTEDHITTARVTARELPVFRSTRDGTVNAARRVELATATDALFIAMMEKHYIQQALGK